MTASMFGAVLRDARMAKRQSQMGLAAAAGCDPSYVSRLEAGARAPSRAAVCQFADALQLSSDGRATLLEAAGFAGSESSLPWQVRELAAVVESPRLPAAVRAVLLGMVQQLTRLGQHFMEVGHERAGYDQGDAGEAADDR